MFFHIDESGNTGNNLFDAAQPRLSYGVLSSLKNCDVLCTGLHNKIQKVIGCDQIHASQLGTNKLSKIVPILHEIQCKMNFDFDYYFIEKKEYALVLFFDAVFDAGCNDAVSWDIYWTPMRYLVIHKLSVLFDEELLKETWRLCTSRRIEDHENEIVQLLSEVSDRAVKSNLDERSIEIIVDALSYGISHPLKLDFGVADQKIVSPNAVGFQFVVSCISRRVRKKKRKKAKSILVDRQNQFNNAQIGTHYNLSRIADGIKNAPHDIRNKYLQHPLYTIFDEADIRLDGVPGTNLTISRSLDSIGLQIVDVYLWMANRIISGMELPKELRNFCSTFMHRSTIDGISLDGMASRFSNFENTLPELENLSEEQLEIAKSFVNKHRDKVKDLGSRDV